MMTRIVKITAGVGSLLVATVAHAHPGHGEPGDDFGLAHYVTEPFHVGIGICLLIATACIARVIRARIQRRGRQESAA